MEKEWIAKSRQGDEEAFTELVMLYRPRIYQECLSLLHERALAEDVTQESFIRAYNHLKDFQERSSFLHVALAYCAQRLYRCFEEGALALRDPRGTAALQKGGIQGGPKGSSCFLPTKHRRRV